MRSTLKERMARAFEARQKSEKPPVPPAEAITKAELARFCGVSAPSVNAWFSGDTKTLKGTSLIRAAIFLDVRPEWLASGIEPMEESDDIEVGAYAAYYDPHPIGEAARAIAHHLRTMSPNQRKGASLYLKQLIDDYENEEEVESLIDFLEALQKIR